MSDLGKKISLLCKRVGITTKYFRAQISKPDTKYHIRGDKIDKWLNDLDEGHDNKPSIDRLRLFWREVYRLHIPESFFYMTVGDFIKELSKVHKFPEKFFTSYQILRPFQNDSSLYAAEAFEIVSDEQGIINLMYSHNYSKKEELYEGVANVAKRYYFSLLSRPHEDGSADSTFRCITFYITEELRGRSSDFLSGIMLRGVSGTTAPTKDYAVAVPFLAIPLNREHSLRNIDPIDLYPTRTTNKLYQLHEDGSLFVGVINRYNKESMFDFCRNIFENDEFKKELFQGNPLAIHTIRRNRLSSLNINAGAWESCVKKTSTLTTQTE